MTNMCHNIMKITGAISEISRFKQTCICTAFENKQAQLNFRAIMRPQDNWGTSDVCVWVDAPGCYEFAFLTIYSPPVAVWEKMAEMFPALEFSLRGSGDQLEFAFEGTIRGGKLELWEVPVIWTITDPKTGETISGPRPQIDPLLFEKGSIFVSVSAGKVEVDTAIGPQQRKPR
jgi:hypothetical protein